MLTHLHRSTRYPRPPQIGRSLLVIPLADQLNFNLHAEAEGLAKWLSTPAASKALSVTIPKTLKLKKEMADLAKQAAQVGLESE